MKYSVIEDCSPYYTRFTFDSLQTIANLALNMLPEKVTDYNGYGHETFSEEDANKIFSLLPMADVIKFKSASVFTTPPAGGCGIHKDGKDHRVSFNIPLVEAKDCATTWYTDFHFENFKMNTLGGYTRNVFPNWNDMEQFTPAKSLVAQQGEMILFNTDIYHAWQNKGPTTRKMLILRSENPGLLNFYQVRKLLGV